MRRILFGLVLLFGLSAWCADAPKVREGVTVEVKAKTGEAVVTVTVDVMRSPNLDPREQAAPQRRLLMRAIELLRDSIEALKADDAALDKAAAEAAARAKEATERTKAARPQVEIKE
jgi:hypothetical protein